MIPASLAVEQLGNGSIEYVPRLLNRVVLETEVTLAFKKGRRLTLARDKESSMTHGTTSTQGGTTNPSTSSPLIGSDRVEGTAVYDRTGKHIGTIKRLVIDKVSGQVAYAVVSFGGFLGMGANEFPIPWRKLDYDTTLGGFRTDITEEQLRKAPTLNRLGDGGTGGDFDWSDRPREKQLYDYYGVEYYRPL
jgi:PRC-barrel domain